jgi:hypothetical protein
MGSPGVERIVSVSASARGVIGLQEFRCCARRGGWGMGCGGVPYCELSWRRGSAARYLIAKTFGGEATPAGRLRGEEVSRHV